MPSIPYKHTDTYARTAGSALKFGDIVLIHINTKGREAASYAAIGVYVGRSGVGHHVFSKLDSFADFMLGKKLGEKTLDVWTVWEFTRVGPKRKALRTHVFRIMGSMIEHPIPDLGGVWEIDKKPRKAKASPR